MNVMITPPRLTGKSDRDKLVEMGSYLTKLANDLNIVLMNMGTSDAVMQRVNQALAAQGEKTITESSWNTIKSLIIKSADIIEVYQEKIGAELAGNYVAISEFGTFQEETNAKLEATSQGITQNYDNIQKIEINYNGLSSNVDGLNTDVGGLQLNYEGLSSSVGGLSANVDQITEDMGGISSNVEGLSANLDGLTERTDGIRNDFNNRVGDVEQNVNGLTDTVGGLSAGLGALEGDLEGLGADVGALSDAISNLSYSIIKVNAHINTGLLYYDSYGIPVYGMEVGQRTEVDGVEIFNKFARFTANRLSFYDQNGNEVAYISDRKLYIAHVEVLGSMLMGGFKDTVQADGSIVTKWIGV